MHLGRSPLPKWWHQPWVNDERMDGRMRDADDEDEISQPRTASGFIVGGKIEALFGGGAQWVSGKITSDCGGEAFDVEYNDGRSESGVAASMIRPIYLMREQDDGDSVRDEADPDKDFVSEPPPESGPWSDHELGASLGVDAGAEPEAQPGAVARGLSKRPSRAPTRSSPRFASMSDDGNAADSMLARLQLRGRFDEAEQAAEQAADDADGAADAVDPDDATPDASAAGEGPTAGSSPVPSDASSRARVSAHVMSPHGPIHKSTWNIHLLTAKSRGEKLTPCRVGRAAQAAKLACLEQASNSAFASGGTLGRGTDVCCTFLPEKRGDDCFVQCGRISAIYDSKGHELTKPVAFADRAGKKIVGRWYEAVGETGLLFSYSEDDSTRYDATCVVYVMWCRCWVATVHRGCSLFPLAFLCRSIALLPKLRCNLENGLYALDPGDKEIIDQARAAANAAAPANDGQVG